MKTLFSLLLLTGMMLGQSGQAKLECFGDLNGTVEPCRKLLGQTMTDQEAHEAGAQALVGHLQSPLITTQQTLTMLAGDSSVSITCKQWKPSPKDCQIESAKSLDDLVLVLQNQFRNTEHEREGWQAEIDRLEGYQYKYLHCWEALQLKATPKPKTKP